MSALCESPFLVRRNKHSLTVETFFAGWVLSHVRSKTHSSVAQTGRYSSFATFAGHRSTVMISKSTQRSTRCAGIGHSGFDGLMIQNYGDVPFFANGQYHNRCDRAYRLSYRRAPGCKSSINVLRNASLLFNCTNLRCPVYTSKRWQVQASPTDIIQSQAAEVCVSMWRSQVAIPLMWSRHAAPLGLSDLGCTRYLSRGHDGLIVSSTATVAWCRT